MPAGSCPPEMSPTAPADAAEEGHGLCREDLWRRDWRGSQHRGPIAKLVALPRGGKYVSAGRDGTLRVWGRDLAPLQALPCTGAAGAASRANNPPGDAPWAIDAVRMMAQGQERLMVASADRSLSIFNILLAEDDPNRPDERNCLGYGGRLMLPAASGPATCLAATPAALIAASSDAPSSAAAASTPAPGEQQLAFGTAAGAVCLLRCALPSLAAERALRPRQDFVALHKDHAGGVTQLLHVPDVGLLSSSLDATVKVFDPARGAVTATAGLHSKEVRCMAYSAPLSLMISGGTERSALLWHPRGDPNHKVGELPAHPGGVIAVAAAEHRRQHQAFTLAGDGSVAVWDLRTLRALRRLENKDWGDAEDACPGAMMYDAEGKRLVTATRRPAVWSQGPLSLPPRAAGAVDSKNRSAAECSVADGEETAMGPDAADAVHSGGGGADGGDDSGDDSGEEGSGKGDLAAGKLPWTDPPLWMRPHSRLHLGAIPPACPRTS